MDRAEYKRAFRELNGDVRRILHKQWDSIGIQDEPEAYDEYYNYADAITWKVVAGATASEIADYLDHVLVEWMGFEAWPEKSRKIAEKLVALRVE